MMELAAGGAQHQLRAPSAGRPHPAEPGRGGVGSRAGALAACGVAEAVRTRGPSGQHASLCPAACVLARPLPHPAQALITGCPFRPQASLRSR